MISQFGGGSGGIILNPGNTAVIQQRNATTSQEYQLYTTYTSATSYERINVRGKASANFEIGPENGSAGGTLRGLTIGCYPAGTSTIVGWAQFRPNASTGAIEAFYLGPIADSTATGGNARGTNSVDLQTLRSAAASVASGTGASIIGGNNNSATGNYSFAIGTNNAGTGVNSFCGGTNSTASGQWSLCFGTYATASGSTAIALGTDASASGSSSVCIGPNTSNTTYSIAIGAYSRADRYSQLAYAGGRFAANGDAQSVSFVLRNKTTDATATVLFLDGSSTRLTIPSGKIMFCDILISGIKSDGSASACYKRKVAIKNVAGTTALVGTVEAIGTDIEDNVLTDVAITADNTNDALDISVTGIAAETWRWVAVVEGLEIEYGV